MGDRARERGCGLSTDAATVFFGAITAEALERILTLDGKRRRQRAGVLAELAALKLALRGHAEGNVAYAAITEQLGTHRTTGWRRRKVLRELGMIETEDFPRPPARRHGPGCMRLVRDLTARLGDVVATPSRAERRREERAADKEAARTRRDNERRVAESHRKALEQAQAELGEPAAAVEPPAPAIHYAPARPTGALQRLATGWRPRGPAGQRPAPAEPGA